MWFPLPKAQQIPIIDNYIAVKALREIAAQMGKKDWNFSVDPCINESSWATSQLSWSYKNSIICNCLNHNVCHVVEL